MFLKSLHTLILATHTHPAINLIVINSNPHSREHQDVCTPVVWWASCATWDKVQQLLSPYPVSVVLLNKKCQASLWADLSYPAGITSYYGKVIYFIILLTSNSLNLRPGCCPLSTLVDYGIQTLSLVCFLDGLTGKVTVWLISCNLWL